MDEKVNLEQKEKMPKALILTVGAQGEQIIFSIKSLSPQYVGFLATNTLDSKNTVDKIVKECNIPASNFRLLLCEDNPSEIGRIISNFREIYKWLTEEEGVSSDEIFVDPTGGRKWMSSGIMMIASFLGLKMIYVDVSYKESEEKKKEPDSSTMKIVSLGNAYEQVGFLEEDKADELFNNYEFKIAKSIYLYLQKHLYDPRRVEIKSLLCDGFYKMWEFFFKDAYEILKEALEKIFQYQLLKEYKEDIERILEILSVLKDDEESKYFQLLKNDKFVRYIILFLYFKSKIYGEKKNFDEAVIMLYRILELISQHRLALHEIDSNNVSSSIREKYNQEFKAIKKEIIGTESEIGKKIGLLDGWILLWCLKDKFLCKKEKDIRFLKGLKDKIELRNLLWIEHKNKKVSKEEYEEFKRYVESWMKFIDKNLPGEVSNIEILKFKRKD